MQAILTSALDYKIDKIIHKNKKYETSWVKFGYFFNQIYIKDENIILKLQSMNCGGWNSVKNSVDNKNIHKERKIE